MGLSQQQMASRIGVSLNSYGRYERGARSPGADELSRLRESGISIDWLLTGEGPLWAASARLDEIEAKIDGLSAEERRGVIEDLESIARARDVPDSQRNRASIMLDFLRGQDECGDSEESEESEMRPMSPEATARTDAVAARIAQGAQDYQDVVDEVGWTPPEMTGIVLRDAVAMGHLSCAKLKHILRAMKYDAGE